MTAARRIPRAGSLVVDGRSLTIPDLVAVARDGRRVVLAPDAVARMDLCRVVVDVLLDHGQKVYGLTTGFGRLRDVMIPRELTAQLQENLIRSHAAGVGDPFPEDVVRAALLLRINTVALGHSGVRPLVVQHMVRALNDRVFPHVPAKGSVGASGDLAPLSHLVLALIGDPDGRVFDPRRRRAGEHFVARPRDEDFVPVRRLRRPRLRLLAKEGLALNNGTQFMAALLALAVHDGRIAAAAAATACALSHDAQGAVHHALDDRVHEVRDLPHQKAVARRVRSLLEGSEIATIHVNTACLRRAARKCEEALDHLGRAGLRRGRLAAGTRAARSAIEVERRSARAATAGMTADDPADPFATSSRRQLRVHGERLRPLRAALARACLLAQETAVPAARAEDLRKAGTALGGARALLDAAVPQAPPVQEDYSFRCFPQVAASAWRALADSEALLRVEMNAATDNPLLFPPAPPRAAMTARAYRAWLEEKDARGRLTTAARARLRACIEGVIGGGNFHGEPLAIAADHLAIAMAELGNIAERRIAHLVDEHTSNGLPPFLIEGVGLNSGFMIPQYTAAALVSESKVLCHPASVDSIPTSANAEDHVSMGTHAARKCRDVIDHVMWIVAIELLTAQQGIAFRAPLRPGRGVRRVLATLGKTVWSPDLTRDRTFHAALARARGLVGSGGASGAERAR